MAYSDQLGASLTKVFGCSFKSITAQMGFNSQPTVFTLVVVEENNQDFTLDQSDVRSVQEVTFGSLSMLGIVQSWERTTTDPNGTGIYTVRMTDGRTVIDAAHFSNVFFESQTGDVQLIDENVVYIPPEEPPLQFEPTFTIPDEQKGVFFSTFMRRVEASTFAYGPNNFRIDMSEMLPLKSVTGLGVTHYFVQGEIRSLTATITEFCNAVGAEWWVESSRNSVVDDTIVIKIKIVQRIDRLGNAGQLNMDGLAALHEGHIMRRKDGFESNDSITTSKIIWGGPKMKLMQQEGSIIKQFWGFDETGQPLEFPSFLLPNEEGFERVDSSIVELENVLNNNLQGTMDSLRLRSLNKYMSDFWGKKFYFSVGKTLFSDLGNALLNLPKATIAGWWENAGHPNGGKLFSTNDKIKLTTPDNRWFPFVELPSLTEVTAATEEAPDFVPIEWANLVNDSTDVVDNDLRLYMRCNLSQLGPYIIMTLPTALTRISIDSETGAYLPTRFTREMKLTKSWTPFTDTNVHYGPWSNVNILPGDVPSPGKSEVFIDNSLFPWMWGTRDTTNDIAMNNLRLLVEQRIGTVPSIAILNTGQLEVAGIPKINIGQLLGIGGSVTEIFIRFDANGVITRYTMNLFTRELGEFKRKKRELAEVEQIEREQEPEPEFVGPTDEEITLTGVDFGDDNVDTPEGGLGTIISKGGGPFYNIKRTNFRLNDAGVNTHKTYLNAEWLQVRNLSETDESPGYLIPGTNVNVVFFSEASGSPFIPYVEQTPQVFSPPPLSE